MDRPASLSWPFRSFKSSGERGHSCPRERATTTTNAVNPGFSDLPPAKKAIVCGQMTLVMYTGARPKAHEHVAMKRFEDVEAVLQLVFHAFVVGVFLTGGIEGGRQLVPSHGGHGRQALVVALEHGGALVEEFPGVGVGETQDLHHADHVAGIKRGELGDAVAGELGVAGEVVAGRQLALAVAAVDGGQADEVILAIHGDDLGLHQDGIFGDGLVVQVAGNDEQDGAERAQGARFAGGELGLKADLEGWPGEQVEALATAGVVPQHEAVVERAAGVVFKLEILEAEVVLAGRATDN